MFVKRLRQVQQRLLEQSVRPEICRFNMKYFGISSTAATEVLTEPICHTQACIAGETILQQGLAVIPGGGGFILTDAARTMAAVKANDASFDEEFIARKLLGLTKEQGYRLFYLQAQTPNNIDSWPKEMEQAYKNAKTATQRALIGAQRIELFIQSNGTR